MDSHADIHRVLAAYPAELRSGDTHAIGAAGGFSGAAFWRIESARGMLCLRRWPSENASATRLKYLHRVLLQVAPNVGNVVPTPIATCHGLTFHHDGAHFWELTPWMPGHASFHQSPSSEKLQAAMQTLARFHLASEQLPEFCGQKANSPGIQQRLSLLRSFDAATLGKLEHLIPGSTWREIQGLGMEILHGFQRGAAAIETTLIRANSLPVPLQPCIRDIWHDHVLYTDNRVTGIVDFGAMNQDNVATDIARLLGSLVGDDVGRWQEGIDAYQRHRRLSDEELRLIPAFDRSSVLLSGMNWLRWIVIENRSFEDRRAVEARLAAIILRLRGLDGKISGFPH